MFVGDSHDLLVLDQDGEGQKFQLAPGTFNSRPTSQDLIDYASIFDVAGLTGADGAETKTGGSGATATSALDQCDQAASDSSDHRRAATPVADAQLRAAEAVEACRKGLAERPDEPRLQYQLARALRAAGDGEAANQLIRRAANPGTRPPSSRMHYHS